MIVFQCEHCKAKLQVPGSKAGKKGRCPRCGEMVPVPEADQSAQGHPPIPAPGLKSSADSFAEVLPGPQDPLPLPSMPRAKGAVASEGTPPGQAHCFFCACRPPAPTAAMKVPMYRIVKTTDTFWGAWRQWGPILQGLVFGPVAGVAAATMAQRLPEKAIFYQPRTVFVPRCDACRSAHHSWRMCQFRATIVWTLLGGLVGGLIDVLLILPILGKTAPLGAYLVAPAVAAFFGALLGWTVPPRALRGTKPEYVAKQSPEVLYQVQRGFLVGSKPLDEFGKKIGVTPEMAQAHPWDFVVAYLCDKCGLELESPIAMEGKTDKCPACGAEMVVP